MANLRTDNLCGEGGRNAYRGSVFFDGDNDYIDISNSVIAAAIPGGDEPYTIEMWVLFGRGGSTVDSGGSDSLIAYGSNSTRSYNGIDWTGTAIRNVWYGDDLSYTVDLTDGEWHHVAATYDQTTRRLFVDGNLGASDTPSDHSVGTTNNGKIGASTGGVINRDFKGHISNLRITKRAIYTAAFTPPTQELTAVDDTMLLCCQDSNDPNQEATGKTITGNGNLATAGYLGTQPKVIPPYGVDAGNTFNGAISMNSSAYMHFPTGRTEERGRGRGFYMLGYNGTPSASFSSRIDYIEIQSQGNTIRFGDLTTSRYTLGAGASSTRGLFTGGYQDGLSPDTDVNTIEFITIATEGKAQDFGDRTQVGRVPACASNDTRCVMASAFTPAGYQNTIDFVTIATIGNASDFGDLSTARAGMSMSCNSTTRGIFNGGYQPAPTTIRVNNMEYITFSTTGNTQDFGDLTDDSQATSGGTASSSTRGLIGLGYVNPTRSNAIDFCTIATLANALDFGDLTAAKQSYGSCSNSTRGLFFGGQTPSYINNIDFVSIATTGDATDFGDVDVGVTASGAAGSDSHGGLS